MGGTGGELPFGGEEAGLELFFVAALAEDIPAFGVFAIVFFDVGFGGLERVVGGIVGAVEEEGLISVSFGFFQSLCSRLRSEAADPVIIYKVDGVVGDDVGGVEGFVFVGGGDFPGLAVEAEGVVAGEEVGGAGEVAPIAVEAEVGGLFGEVPFANHHGVVTGGGHDFGDGGSAGEFFAAGLITVEAGEEGDTGGVALGGVVELGEAEAILSEGVEVGGVDLGAVAA